MSDTLERARWTGATRMLANLAPAADRHIRMQAAACLANLRNPPDVLLILADAIDEMRRELVMPPARNRDLDRIATLLRAEAPHRIPAATEAA